MTASVSQTANGESPPSASSAEDSRKAEDAAGATGPNAAAAGRMAARWEMLEVVRWPAIYAIVYLHAVRSTALQPSTVLTRFAVPFFVAASVFLVFYGVWRKPQRRFASYAWNRFLRIYVPFLVWSAIYLGFKAAKSASLPDQPNEYPTGIAILWTGTFYHLWFMPFIFVVGLVAMIGAKAVHAQRWLWWPLMLGALIVGAVLCLPRESLVAALRTVAAHAADALNTAPFTYMLDALPSALWGSAAGLVFCRTAPSVNPPRAQGDAPPSVPFAVPLLIFGVSMAALAVWGRSTILENAAGVALLLLALRPIGATALARLAALPPLAYGIYFCHCIPIKICESLAAKLHLASSAWLDIAVFAVSAAAATLGAWVLYQWRGTRWLVA